MPALSYVNGHISRLADATIPVGDRGFLFADSIYEVVAFLNGRLLDWDKHLWRLRNNAAALFLSGLPTDAALSSIAKRLIAATREADGILYIQLTRGTALRDHGFPKGTRPNLVMTARRFDFRGRIAQQQAGVAAISLPDQRWARCDLKTTGLLPAVLAKEEARRKNAFEAIFHTPEGTVTEGASTNIWMVSGAGAIVTHPLSTAILPGIMRDTLMHLARGAGIVTEERAFTLAEARAAPELFLTSTTAPLLPIVSLDDAPIGQGCPGPVTARLAALLWQEVERQTGWQVV